MANDITGSCEIGVSVELVPDDVDNIVPPGYLDEGTLDISTGDTDIGVDPTNGSPVTGWCSDVIPPCSDGKYPLGSPQIFDCYTKSYDSYNDMVISNNNVVCGDQSNTITGFKKDMLGIAWTLTPNELLNTYKPDDGSGWVYNKIYNTGYMLVLEDGNIFIPYMMGKQNQGRIGFMIIVDPDTGVVLKHWFTPDYLVMDGGSTPSHQVGLDFAIQTVQASDGTLYVNTGGILDRKIGTSYTLGCVYHYDLNGNLLHAGIDSTFQRKNSNNYASSGCGGIAIVNGAIYVGTTNYTTTSGSQDEIGYVIKFDMELNNLGLHSSGDPGQPYSAYGGYMTEGDNYIAMRNGWGNSGKYFQYNAASGENKHARLDLVDKVNFDFVKTITSPHTDRGTAEDYMGTGFGRHVSRYGNFIMVSAGNINGDGEVSAINVKVYGKVYLYDSNWNFISEVLGEPKIGKEYANCLAMSKDMMYTCTKYGALVRICPYVNMTLE